MFLKQNLLTPCCINCGSFFVEEHLFCADCFKSRLQININSCPEFSEYEESKHVYLIDWQKNQSESLDQLVYRLKCDNSVLAIENYANLLGEKLNSVLDLKEYSALIPIPSANVKSVHAHLIAACLSVKVKLPVYDILTKAAASPSQKKLTAVERKTQNPFSLKLELAEDFTRFKEVQKTQALSCIFVDDVMTTGQSFKRCSEALIGSKRNAIATLFYRPSLIPH